MGLLGNLLIIAKSKAVKINDDITEKALEAQKVIAENKKIQLELQHEKQALVESQKRDQDITKILIELKQFYKPFPKIIKELESLSDHDLKIIDKVGLERWKKGEY